MPAALLNLAALLVTEQPVFDLPLRSGKGIMGSREWLHRLSADPESAERHSV